MTEDKTNKLLNKIEKLIVDGNKEVLTEVKRVENSLNQKIDTVKQELKQEINGAKQDLRQEIGRVEKSLQKQIKDTYDLLSYDIREVDKKLDAHLRVPHAA